MSDFLTNLAVRDSRSAEVIRPRLPSLFEPPRLAERLPAPAKSVDWEENRETFEGTTEPSEAATVPARGPSPADERLAGRRVQSRLAVPQRAHDVPGPVPTTLARSGETGPDPIRPQTRPADQAVESPPNSPQTLVPRSSTETPVRRSSSQTPLPESSTQTPVRESSTRTPVREFLVATTPTDTARNEGDRSQPGPSADRATPVTETRKSLSSGQEPSEGSASSTIVSPSLQADQIAQLVKSIVQRRIASHSEDPKPGTLPSRSNQPEPAIQVTIGRIEVRATREQQPAPRERAVSPVMSLEDYLRSRQKRVRE